MEIEQDNGGIIDSNFNNGGQNFLTSQNIMQLHTGVCNHTELYNPRESLLHDELNMFTPFCEDFLYKNPVHGYCKNCEAFVVGKTAMKRDFKMGKTKFRMNPNFLHEQMLRKEHVGRELWKGKTNDYQQTNFMTRPLCIKILKKCYESFPLDTQDPQT